MVCVHFCTAVLDAILIVYEKRKFFVDKILQIQIWSWIMLWFIIQVLDIQSLDFFLPKALKLFFSLLLSFHGTLCVWLCVDQHCIQFSCHWCFDHFMCLPYIVYNTPICRYGLYSGVLYFICTDRISEYTLCKHVDSYFIYSFRLYNKI